MNKILDQLTREIIDHFRMPVKLCTPYIREQIQRAYTAGFDYGRKQRLHCKPILQHHENGKFIRRWNSIEEAARALDTYPESIGRVCRGRQRTHHGYIFQFENPNDFTIKSRQKSTIISTSSQ